MHHTCGARPPCGLVLTATSPLIERILTGTPDRLLFVDPVVEYDLPLSCNGRADGHPCQPASARKAVAYCQGGACVTVAGLCGAVLLLTAAEPDKVDTLRTFLFFYVS